MHLPFRHTHCTRCLAALSVEMQATIAEMLRSIDASDARERAAVATCSYDCERVMRGAAPVCICGDDHDCRSEGCDPDCARC